MSYTVHIDTSALIEKRPVDLMFHYFLLLLHTAVSASLPSCDDVLEESQRLREEIKWLNDVIANNITELAAMIAAGYKL